MVGRVLFALELFFAHGDFGSAHGGFRGVFVDIILVDGHIGENRDLVRGDFDEAASHREVVGFPFVGEGEIAGLDLHDEADVAGQDAELAVEARDHDAIDFPAKCDALRRDDVELQGHGVYSRT